MSDAIQPFRIEASDAELEDLKRRLAATRWPDKETVSDWSQGIPLAYVQELCEYWSNEYDWRAREAHLNEFAQFKTEIDGLGIHFVHVKSPEPNALPLIITHGWPGSIVEFHKVSKGFGDRTLMNQWTQHMKRNDRVGLVGPNGSGKSTLLGMMTGNLEPDAGKVVIGEPVRFGHFTQEPPAFDPEMKVIEAVHEIAEYMPLKKGKKLSAAQLLERFLFPRSMHHQFIRKLSGGERKRLQMLRVLMANPNFLVLDEPTNDLDVFALGILEEFLLEFPGCLVVVSHDRYFMDKMVEHVWVLEEGGGMRDFPGNYTQYRTATDAAERQTSADKKQADRSAATTRPNTGPTAPPKGDYSNRLSFKEQYEYDHLEENIEKLEQERSNLEAELAEKSAEHDEVLRISVVLGKVVDKIDKKTLRWIELSERA